MKKFQVTCRTVRAAKWDHPAEDLETAVQDVRELIWGNGGILPIDYKHPHIVIALYADGRFEEYWVTHKGDAT